LQLPGALCVVSGLKLVKNSPSKVLILQMDEGWDFENGRALLRINCALIHVSLCVEHLSYQMFYQAHY
jgi:hypothetical protein